MAKFDELANSRFAFEVREQHAAPVKSGEAVHRLFEVLGRSLKT